MMMMMMITIQSSPVLGRWLKNKYNTCNKKETMLWMTVQSPLLMVWWMNGYLIFEFRCGHFAFIELVYPSSFILRNRPLPLPLPCPCPHLCPCLLSPLSLPPSFCFESINIQFVLHYLFTLSRQFRSLRIRPHVWKLSLSAFSNGNMLHNVPYCSMERLQVVCLSRRLIFV